jgi:CubicO group peptidase (beta-lactamase class C family)
MSSLRGTLALAALAGCPAPEPEDTAEPPFEMTAERIAAIEAAAQADLDAGNATVAQIAIWREGEIVYEGVIGQATTVGGDAVAADTLLQIGSDTKKMTAIVAHQLADDGALDLDAPLPDVLVDFSLEQSPEWAASATVADLLAHRGGLFDYTPWDPAPNDSELADRAYGEFAESGWAVAPADATWNYSNPNFSLAGLASERAAGQPWPDLVVDTLFSPLGLDDTFARKLDFGNDPNVALGVGYAGFTDDPFDPIHSSSNFTFGTVPLEDVADNGWTRPAGLVWSTATDQARLGAFLVDGDPTVLSEEARATITTARGPLYPAWDAQGYGHGLFVIQGINLGSEFYDIPAWTHGGNTLAYTSATWMLPEQRVALSILGNGYGVDFTSTAVTIMAQVAELPEPTSRPAIPSAETPHAALAGTYVDPYIGRIVISDVDGALQIAMPDLAAEGLAILPGLRYADLTDVYDARVDGQWNEIVFVPDDDGVYRWARNRLFVGTRDDTSAALGARPVRRSAADLRVAIAEGAADVARRRLGTGR